MKIAIVLLVVAACALAQDNVFPADSLSENALAPEEDLLSAVKELRRVSDGTAYHTHGERIEDHAVLIQKAKAYKHSFGARNALRAAIRALVSELTTGHNHDRSALSRERNAGHNAIRNALNRGKSTAGRYREKACPTKKAQVEAEAARNSAKGRMNAIKRRKVCNLSTSWFDMNIKGSAPKFGGELRNKWDKARADYLRKLAAYNAAVRKYNKAAREHSGAMAAFRATVKAEAANAHSACRNAHKAYDLLAKDVASNVRTRKQVYIASKVITCYIDNLSNNGGAKGCADRARRANTSRWNITPSKMNACLNHVALQAQIGPLSWRPSKRNCHANHWNERGIKERNTKERNTKERNNKERATKERKHKNMNSTVGCRGKNAANGNGRCFLHYGGGYYRTLAAADPWGRYGTGRGRSSTCENHYQKIPPGCHIAPNNGHTQAIARDYAWQTHVLCIGTGGWCMGTTQYSRGNWYRRGGGIQRNHKGEYRVTGCSLRLLLKCDRNGRE